MKTGTDRWPSKLASALFCCLCVQFDGLAAETILRRPIALATSPDGRQLFTANRDSATISVIDIRTRTVATEIKVGGKLSDLAVVHSDQLLVLDAGQHRLVSIRRNTNGWETRKSIELPDFPVRLCVDRASNRCYVASSWSRSLTILDLEAILDGETEASSAEIATLPLPIEPREMCLDRESRKLILAGAFAANLAVIDCERMCLDSVRSLPGHNIRGMAIGRNAQLLLSMQEINPLAHSTQDDVHWGNMLANLLVAIPMDCVLSPQIDLADHRTVTLLGEPGRAAGDPGQISFDHKDSRILLLSGVDQVALGSSSETGQNQFERVDVGLRPVAAACSNAELFVANMFSDTVSIIDLASRGIVDSIALGEQPPLTAAEKGEILFFSSKLSHDGWMSCHSCHSEGHTNGQLNDNLSDGGFGDAKLVPSLFGVAETSPWGWNGSVTSLQEQVINSIEKTMRGVSPEKETVEALTAFMQTLKIPRAEVPNSDAEEHNGRGQELFNSLGCANCHAPPTYTSNKTFDVGLVDAMGNARFNPPSLRGVKYRRSFLHDGRARSLESVFGKFEHQLLEQLDETEVNALVDYLKSL